MYAPTTTVTDPLNKYLCPKCGVNKGCELNCCAPGGSWINDCSDDIADNKKHRWDEGKQACESKFATD